MKFWKKEDDDPFASDSLTQDFSQEFSTPPTQTPTAPNTQNPQDPISQFTPDNHPPGMTFAPADAAPAAKGQENNWQYDVIIARLDSIKSQLDVVTHRIERLEQQAPKKESGRGPWYTK